MRPLAARPRAVTVRRLLMDSLLRTAGITHLIFSGVATNVCVESTLRDAFFHEYRPLLVADATMATRTADVLDWLRSASTA